jgi:hypothetical protein
MKPVSSHVGATAIKWRALQSEHLSAIIINMYRSAASKHVRIGCGGERREMVMLKREENEWTETHVGIPASARCCCSWLEQEFYIYIFFNYFAK